MLRGNLHYHIKDLAPIPFRDSLPETLPTTGTPQLLESLRLVCSDNIDNAELMAKSEFEQWLYLTTIDHSPRAFRETSPLSFISLVLKRAARSGEIWNPLLDLLASHQTRTYAYGNTINQPLWSAGRISRDREAIADHGLLPSPKEWLAQSAHVFQSLTTTEVDALWAQYKAPSLQRALVRYALDFSPLTLTEIIGDPDLSPLFLARTDLSPDLWRAAGTLALTSLEDMTKAFSSTSSPLMHEDMPYSTLAASIAYHGTVDFLTPTSPHTTLLLQYLDPRTPITTLPRLPLSQLPMLASRHDLAPELLGQMRDMKAKEHSDRVKRHQFVYSSDKPTLWALISKNRYIGQSTMLYLLPELISYGSQDPLMNLVARPEATLEFYRQAFDQAPQGWDRLRPALATKASVRSDAPLRTRLERCRITPILRELVKDPNPLTFARIFPRLVKYDKEAALDLLESGLIPATAPLSKSMIAPILAHGTEVQRRRAVGLLSRLLASDPIAVANPIAATR